MKKYFAVAALVLICLSSMGCEFTPKKNDNSLLMLLLLDQLSGNCATITRSSATLYQATGVAVPKAVCRNTARFYTDATAAWTQNNTEWNQALALLTGTNCATSRASAQAIINGLASVATITTTASSGNPRCALLTSINMSAPIYYCIDQANINTSITNMAASTRYQVVSDVKIDMATSWNFIKPTVTSYASFGFTSAAIAAATPMDSAFASILTGAPEGWAFGLSMSTPACVTDVLRNAPGLKAQVARAFGVTSTYGITAADASAVTSVLVMAAPVTCAYGSSFIPTVSNGVCPTTYPTW